MKKLYKITFVGLFFILFLTKCKTNDEKFVSEGKIEYSAEMVDKTNSMASMAPTKMTIKFKKNKSCVEMSAGMGMFSTCFVSNPDNKSLTQMVKLLNKKFWLTEDANTIKKENDSYKFEIKPSNETKIIAGYKCLKATVHIKDSDDPDFTVYYTKDLNIHNPNFSNPFSEIDGVLMEYQMKKFGLEMKFVANKVIKENVDDAIFQVPEDYKKISKKEMDELFQSLQ